MVQIIDAEVQQLTSAAIPVAHGSSSLADEPGVDYRVRGALGADGEDAALAVQPEGLAQGRGPGGGNGGGQSGDGGSPLNPFKSA